MRISDWSSDVCSSDLTAAAWWIAGPDGEAWVARLEDDDLVFRIVGDESEVLRLSEPGYTYTGLEDLGTSIAASAGDRQSVVTGQSMSVRVALGGRRILKKKNTIQYLKTFKTQL